VEIYARLFNILYEPYIGMNAELYTTHKNLITDWFYSVLYFFYIHVHVRHTSPCVLLVDVILMNSQIGSVVPAEGNVSS